MTTTPSAQPRSTNTLLYVGATQTAPDGTAYRLRNASLADSTDNLNVTYTLNASTELANGTWKPRVQDIYRTSDAGCLDA